MRISVETLLPVPPEAVWALLTDWERQADWMPDVAWLRVLDSERELGARVAVRTKVLGVPIVTDQLEVTGWDPPRTLTVRHVGLVSGSGQWVLRPEAGGGTMLLWTEELRMAPPLLGDLALWLYGPVQRWMVRRSLRNLAVVLAAGAT